MRRTGGRTRAVGRAGPAACVARLLLVVIGGCQTTSQTSAPVVVDDAGIRDGAWLHDIATSAGLVHNRLDADYATLQGRFGGGVCVLDVNADGMLDLFFPGSTTAGGPGSQLYVAQPGTPLRYVDEAAKRGLARTGDGGGCLAVDLDGDGRDEVLTTGLAGARLFRDDGSGAYGDVSERLPKIFPADLLTTSAVAFDADGDGLLDLAIANYGHFKPPPAGTPCNGPCVADVRQYDYGSTSLLMQAPDGTFVDHSERLGAHKEPGLVLLATDLDDDGKLDLFVGNDFASVPDHYYRGDGKGGFTDVATELGVAFAASKSGISSMSATDPDFDGDGHLDLVESSEALDGDASFRCVPTASPALCTDVAESIGLLGAKENFRWGQALADFDDDGVLEMLEAVGDIKAPGDADGTGVLWQTKDSPYLWHRTDPKAPFTLADHVYRLGAGTGGRGATAPSTAGRSVVPIDLDADGDLDVVIGSALGRPLLLENVRAPRGHALGITLVGAGKNRRGIGAKVTVHVGSRAMPAIVHAGSGWESSDDGHLHFGLGAADHVDSIEVRWPSGKTSTLAVTPAGAPLVITEP